MPGPLLIPLIAAGTQIGGQVFNGLMQSGENKRNREFQLNMYDRQRQDALSDLEKQNSYNDPSQQMERFTKAGLNPNLIYGQQTQSAVARSAQAGTPQTKAPSADVASIVSIFMNTMLEQQKLSNDKAVLELKKQELELSKVKTDAEKNKLTVDQDPIYGYGGQQSSKLALMDQQVQSTYQKTLIAKNVDERAAIAQSQSLQESAERILSMRQSRIESLSRITTNSARIEVLQQSLDESKARVNNLIRSGELQQLDYDLRKKGIQPNDPIYLRILSRLIDHIQNP
jgi:hypothetical protein